MPLIDTLNIIKDYVNKDDQFTRKTATRQDKFLDQASLTTAKIYIDAHERTAISTVLDPSKV